MGKRVTINGWMHGVRSLGRITFLLVRDRDGISQVVLDSTESDKLKECHVGTVLSVSGLVSASRSKDGKPELKESIVTIISKVSSVPPLDYTRPTFDVDLDFLLDCRGVSIRHSAVSSIFKVQSEIAFVFRKYMREQVGAREFFGPCLLPGSSEGGAEIFFTDHFGSVATLAQSNQLYKQILVGVYERVFAIMPFFRADPSHTTRHLSEGKQMEFEAAFSSLCELMTHLEDFIRDVARQLYHLYPELDSLPLFPEGKFPSISFAEARELLKDDSLSDLGSDEERKLCSWAREKYCSDFLFITHWPNASRPFYSLPSKSAGETETFDLLCRGIEIVSGGMRRFTHDQVLEGLSEHRLSPIPLQGYLQAFQSGMPPHGGFGIGLERLTMALLDLKNIREASLFPSDARRIASEKQLILGGESIRSEMIKSLRRRCLSFSVEISAPKCSEGVKALLLIGKRSGTIFQANLALSSKLQMKLLSALVGEPLTFAQTDVIEEKFGLKEGSIPPAGPLFGVRTFLDRRVMELSETIHFSSGRPGESITLNGTFPIFGPQEIVDISVV